eukprot:SAG31_NODE_496_length_14862_cov_9.280837_12_plen_36_part_00
MRGVCQEIWETAPGALQNLLLMLMASVLVYVSLIY